jgi:hypothetical protein
MDEKGRHFRQEEEFDHIGRLLWIGESRSEMQSVNSTGGEWIGTALLWCLLLLLLFFLFVFR